MAADGTMPLVEQSHAEPPALRVTSDVVRAALVARVLTCKDYALPPAVAAVWRWDERWHPVVSAGRRMGVAFSRGLFRASSENAAFSRLNLRSQLGGNRPTALGAVAALALTVASVDLRDNQLSGAELGVLTDALATSAAVETLQLAGNPLSARELAALFEALVRGGASRLSELDASRTRLMDCGGGEQPAAPPAGSAEPAEVAEEHGGGRQAAHAEHAEHAEHAAVDAMVALGRVVTNGGSLSSLSLAQAGLSDAAAAAFVAAIGKPAPPLPPGRRLQLAHLDLSSNQLGGRFADALAAALAAAISRLPLLATLSLAHNNLGWDAGSVVIRAALAVSSLRTLNLTSTNLCDCSPLYSSYGAPRRHRVDAISALVEALRHRSASSTIEVLLHSNELCAVWSERICGESVMRGAYSAVAFDILVDALDAASVDGVQPLPLRKDSLPHHLGNYVRPVDSQRLANALVANGSKASVSKVGVSGKWLKRGRGRLGSGAVGKAAAPPTAEMPPPGPAGAGSAAGPSTAATPAATDTELLHDGSSLSTAAVEAVGSVEARGVSEGAPVASAAARRRQSVSVRSPRRSGAWDEADPTASGEASATAEGSPKQPAKPAALKRSDTSASPALKPSATPPKPGTLKRSDTSPAGTLQAAPPSDAPLEAAAAETKEEPSPSSASGKAGKRGRKGRGINLPSDDVATSAKPKEPLMIAATLLRARKEAATNSPLVGANHLIAAGTLLYVVEQQQLVTKERGEPIAR